MKAIISSSEIKGTVTAPTSKSYLQRAFAAALLTNGKSRVVFNNFCDDTFAALNIIKTLNAGIISLENGLEITGGISVKGPVLDCFESGLCMRMFSPVAALTSEELTLIGSGSLLKRPQNLIEDALSKFGVSVVTTDSYAPLIIRGPIKPAKVSVDGSMSSQLISGLLLVLPILDGDSEIVIENMVSRRYIDMTIGVLEKFGIRIDREGDNIFKIKGNQKYKETEYKVEGDWSGISFLIVAALIVGRVEINGLNKNSLQADIAILDLLLDMGCNYSISDDMLAIEKSNLSAFEFDATDCPDLFPPLFALAAFSKGVSKIKGVHRLKHKESNRAEVLMSEFKKLGIESFIEDNTLNIVGGKINSGEVSSHNDHRIAMALSVAALSSESPVQIEGVECINKSYPGFFDDLTDLKGNITLRD